MTRLFVSALILTITMPTPLPAASPNPISLAKTERWNLNYGDDSCQLIGVFGTGDDQAFVRFTRFGLEDRFKLALFGKRLGR
jgi:hypothetical protein